MKISNLKFQKILNAIEQREISIGDMNAYRLFNGFYEGIPGLVIDRYGDSLVIFDHREPGDEDELVQVISNWAISALPGIKSILVKQRQSANEEMINGILIAGNKLVDSIKEFGVNYALNLQINQDASFYLDTRNLRRWILGHSTGLRILNTFAYTGSLGVAAGVGGASEVIQTDINPGFLETAKQSWLQNKLDSKKCLIIPGDFFRVTGRLRHSKQLFGGVILDPPYFSATDAGRVNLQGETRRLINKVRPLVAHEGWLAVINNALFFSGKSFMDELNELCQSPYLTFEEIISVPPDITGFPKTISDTPPVNPAPFNHPTKIVILRVFRKDKRK